MKIVNESTDKELVGVFAIYRDVLSDFNFEIDKDDGPVIVKIADLEKNS